MVFGHENEPGFFLGAMIANYFLLTIALLPTLVIPIFVLDWSVSATLLLGVLQVLILFPFLFRFSRLLWLHGEARLTRALDGEGKKGRSPS
jgi:hypothetical protein